MTHCTWSSANSFWKEGSVFLNSLNCRSFAIGFGTGILVCGLTTVTLKILKTKHKCPKKQKTGLETSDCLLFTSPQYVSVLSHLPKFCMLTNCNFCNYKALLDYIKRADFYVDVCVYLITCNEICELLATLWNKKIAVRIITDKQMSLAGKHSKVTFFLKHGIPFKVIDGGGIMHNKFVIIDRKILITGSFNWTHQGFQSNFENAVVLQDSHTVGKFWRYFEDIWVNAAPA